MRGVAVASKPSHKALPRKRERRPNEGERERAWLPKEAPQNHKGALEIPPRNHEPPPEVLPRKGEHKIETPSRGKGKRTEAPPQGTRMVEAMPLKGKHRREASQQGNPNEGEHEPDWAPREVPREHIPSTWEGAAPWDPGGKPPRERTLNTKRPVEAIDIALGIDAPQHNDVAGIDTRKKTQKNLAA